jgi:hypothetical protein
MPTYVCSLAEGSVSDRQKAAIAEALSRIHSKETGAPPYFVQSSSSRRNLPTDSSVAQRQPGRSGSEATSGPAEPRRNAMQ